MQENGAQNRIYLDNSCCIGSEAQRNILNLLEKPDVAACCSVLSQGERDARAGAAAVRQSG